MTGLRFWDERAEAWYSEPDTDADYPASPLFGYRLYRGTKPLPEPSVQDPPPKILTVCPTLARRDQAPLPDQAELHELRDAYRFCRRVRGGGYCHGCLSDVVAMPSPGKPVMPRTAKNDLRELLDG